MLYFVTLHSVVCNLLYFVTLHSVVCNFLCFVTLHSVVRNFLYFVTLHSVVCSCGHGDTADPAGLSKLSREYQAGVQSLINSGRYDGRSDFTVVNQPFFRDTKPPTLVRMHYSDYRIIGLF